MTNGYANIDKALDIESDIVEVDKNTTKIDVASEKPNNEIQKDYEYTRANLYSLMKRDKNLLMV